jgi:hypothetical protein
MTQPEVLTRPRSVQIDPATRFVRSLPGDFIMLREASHALGVSEYVLRKYIADDEPGLQPSKYTMFGKVKIYLYTEEDVKRIEKHLSTRVQVFEHTGQAKKTGRPPKYDDAERKSRDQKHSRAWYWRNRVAILTERGDIAGAQVAQKRLDEIIKELRK